MSSYCTEQDAYRFIPPGMVSLAGRLLSGVDTSADALTLNAHGLALDSPLSLRAESGGSLPSPLVAGTVYYAIPLSSDSFRVASAPGGSAINLTTAGSNIVAIPQLPWTLWIAECSAMLDQVLPAHVVPITGTVPEPVRLYTAALLAMRALAHVGAETAAVQGQIEFWSKQADKWSRAVPLRGANVPASANCAIVGSVSGADPRGWLPRNGGRYLP